MTAIQVFQISKSYRHFPVLNEVSCSVRPGECLALFGPNGAGKTTLLKILATLQHPSSGRFEVMGLDGGRERQRVRERLLLLAHGSFLYPDLKAVENLRFALGLRGLSPSPREIRIALDRVGIGPFSEYKVRYFSEGMKRRLSMAKAILIRPPVLLLDEPYSSLDEPGMAMVNTFLRESLREGAAVLMTSHNRAKTAEVATHAGVIHQGMLREKTVKDLVEADAIY